MSQDLLENVQTTRQIYSVSDITRNIRFTLEENFSNVWVEGEISNFKSHTSGHFYFSLKDEFSQIQCVMFRRESQSLSFELKDGMSTICLGRVSVYAIRGQYQLYVEKVEPKGIGALALRFEALKDKLGKEGLFGAENKKPVPYLPRTIGVVTSIDGAALRDILHVLERRFSGACVLIYPVPVQGAAAAPAIAEAIGDFNEMKNADVLIIGRGGGSLEDLWAFNEEIVARAIFASRIPIISAVGHEVDFTISDFVADLRAATPSAAAEIVLPAREDLVLRLDSLNSRSLQAILGSIRERKQALESLASRRALKSPLGIFEIKFQRLDELKKNLSALFKNFLSFKEENMKALMGKLEALGPLSTLKRGFSVTLKMPEEKVVTSPAALKIGDRVKTRMQKGYFISQVEEIDHDPTTSFLSPLRRKTLS